MKKYVPTTISYQSTGLVKDRDAFVLSDDAYTDLTNCYLWRGRLKRRNGYQLLGRLQRDVTAQAQSNTSASATYSIADLLTSFRATEPNASLSPGRVVIDIDAGGSHTQATDNGTGSFTLTIAGGRALSSSSINYQTGAISLVFTVPLSAGLTVTSTYGYFPSLPCTGIPGRELPAINSTQTLAFDTKYAYQYDNTNQRFKELSASTPTTWSGTETNFFDGLTYWQTTDGFPYFWTTNFHVGDPIRVYDGANWYAMTPPIDGNNSMFQARILVSYKGRMVALNTWEGTTASGAGASVQFPQRARWSQNGAPFTAVAKGVAPVTDVQWLSNVKGRGGYIDAPVGEHITSAEFIRDVLVVGFEHSTWALRYNGNPALPFVWERINKELGTESTFGMVAFDKGILYIGDKSINSCNGNNVDRIDDNIPDEVFYINNSSTDASDKANGALRIHGIRDFFERVVYWAYPNGDSGVTFPNRVLLYNYQNNSWAIFTDSFTAFGEYQKFNDTTWADLSNITWQDCNLQWASAKFKAQFTQIVAGNQQGYVVIVDQQTNNDPSLYIKSITGGATAVSLEVPNHNLEVDDVVYITGIMGTTGTELNNRTFQVLNVTDKNNITLECPARFAITAMSANAIDGTKTDVTATGHNFAVGQHWYIYQVSGVTSGTGVSLINGNNGVVTAVQGEVVTIDFDISTASAYISGGAIQNLDEIPVNTIISAGTYIGGGQISRVMGFTAKSKKFNILDQGHKITIGHIDFLADVTKNGEVSCDVYVDYNDSDPIATAGTSQVNEVFSTQLERFSTRGTSKDWHRFYTNVVGQFLQYSLNLNERQLFTPNIVNSPVLIDSIIIWLSGAGRLE